MILRSHQLFSRELLFHVLKWSEVAQSCPTLCNPMDCSLPGFSIHGILQARILEWVTISFSRGSSWPRDQTQVSRIAGRRFNLWATKEAPKASFDYLKMGIKSTLHFKWNKQDCHFLMTHKAPGYLARLRLRNLNGHCTGVWERWFAQHWLKKES